MSPSASAPGVLVPDDVAAGLRTGDHLALARALPGRRAPGRLPELDRAVPQSAMRRFRPAHIEQLVEVARVVLSSREQALAIARVNRSLFAREETRTDPCARR